MLKKAVCALGLVAVTLAIPALAPQKASAQVVVRTVNPGFNRGGGVVVYRPARYYRGWNNPGWNNPGWNNPGWNNPGWNNPGWNNSGWNNRGWNNNGWNTRGAAFYRGSRGGFVGGVRF